MAKKGKNVDSYPTQWDIINRQPPGWQFLEFPEFSQWWRKYFVTDETYGKFQEELTHNPEHGDVIKGCGGLRKIRWSDSKRGKGKRGGLRIVYFLVPEAKFIVLVDIYGKDDAEDITFADKRRLSRLAAMTKSDVLRRRN